MSYTYAANDSPRGIRCSDGSVAKFPGLTLGELEDLARALGRMFPHQPPHWPWFFPEERYTVVGVGEKFAVRRGRDGMVTLLGQQETAERVAVNLLTEETAESKYHWEVSPVTKYSVVKFCYHSDPREFFGVRRSSDNKVAPFGTLEEHIDSYLVKLTTGELSEQELIWITVEDSQLRS